MLDMSMVEALRDGAATSEIVRAASQDAFRIAVHPQEYFGDEEVRAALDFARSMSRLFILICVSSSLIFICYGAFLLMASGGEPRKMDQSRTIFQNVFIGLLLSISSYLLLSTVISVVVNVVGVPGTVRFWDASVFEDDFGFYELLGGGEYALEGEVIMMDGARPVICEEDLLPVGRESGWTYQTGIFSTELNGCLRG